MLVEGHGEVAAAGNLVSRVTSKLGEFLPWSKFLRWKGLNTKGGLTSGAMYVRARGDACCLLVLRDEEDGCPRERGPEAAACLRALVLPFPSAVVLLKPEYEVLFLPCIESMSGQPIVGADGHARPGLLPGQAYEGDWERLRDVKGWLSARFPPARAYKPTLDQLPFTRMLDLEVLSNAGVPCFGTLERAIMFLARSAGSSAVYP